jgi:hypothetical protein
MKAITQESAFEAFKTMTNTSMVILYSLSKYHEKYHMAGWALTELENRGFVKEALIDFDQNFIDVYKMILTQENL